MADRLRSASWLIAEITELAKIAESNSKSPTPRSPLRDPIAEARCQGAAKADAHWARQLRRILTGKTWSEAFAESAERGHR